MKIEIDENEFESEAGKQFVAECRSAIENQDHTGLYVAAVGMFSNYAPDKAEIKRAEILCVHIACEMPMDGTLYKLERAFRECANMFFCAGL